MRSGAFVMSSGCVRRCPVIYGCLRQMSGKFCVLCQVMCGIKRSQKTAGRRHTSNRFSTTVAPFAALEPDDEVRHVVQSLEHTHLNDVVDESLPGGSTCTTAYAVDPKFPAASMGRGHTRRPSAGWFVRRSARCSTRAPLCHVVQLGVTAD